MSEEFDEGFDDGWNQGHEAGYNTGREFERQLALATLMTDDEHKAMDLSVQLWNQLNKVIKAGDGPGMDGDTKEMCAVIHQIQRAIMCNAAARAYPQKYRLIGGG